MTFDCKPQLETAGAPAVVSSDLLGSVKTMSMMIAKFKVTKVENFAANSQQVTMMAVTEKPFDADGKSDDNSFATWTPSGELKMTITNPNLVGALKEGAKFYLNFSEAAE